FGDESSAAVEAVEEAIAILFGDEWIGGLGLVLVLRWRSGGVMGEGINLDKGFCGS
ncbi:hypothetical protein Tco_0733103, partial [Tanacetum coccineum]